MTMLTADQLTGRSREHVVELSEFKSSLHPRAAEAFLGMRHAAAAAGHDLAPVSAFRDFNQQLVIWNAKFRGERALLDRDGNPLDVRMLSAEQTVRAILHWSALPGASRHHWGTEVDVFDRAALPSTARPQLLPSEYARGGAFAALFAWLAAHAEHYGFYRPYDSDRGGVQVEPWHLSFAPLADALLPQLTPEVVAAALATAPLEGQEIVLRLLPEIHRRYVRAVAAPSAAALAATRLAASSTPAARPS
jgi:LAS superfamily LD-carboxypeptidase LdcB